MTRKKRRSSSLMRARDLARNGQFDAAIRESESALSKNPIDPIKDDIERVKTELRELIATAKKNKFKKLVENKSLPEITKKIEDFEWRKEAEQLIFDWSKQSFGKEKTPSPSNTDAITRAKAYWNNVMCLKSKKELLSVRINELEAYLSENKSTGKKAMAVLSEAVDRVAMSNGLDWTFLMCCRCEKTFLDVVKYKDHMMTEHCDLPKGGLPNLEAMIPKPVPKSEIEIGDWRPVDVITAAKLMEDFSRNKSQDLELHWPYCNNNNRGNLIKTIQSILESYIETKCFAQSHLYILKGLILEMQKNRIPEMLYKYNLIEGTLVSVLFLDELELQRVCDFLREELETSCGLRSLHSSLMWDKLRDEAKLRDEVKLRDDTKGFLKRIALKGDFSCLEIKSSDQECGENIVQWLFEGDGPIGEKMKEWKNYKEDRKSQGRKLLVIIEAEFNRLKNTCEERLKYWRQEEMWQDMERIWIKEDKSGNSQCYRSLYIEKKKEVELEKSDDETRKAKLEIIDIILEEQTDEDIQMLCKKKVNQILGKFFTVDAIIRGTIAAMTHTWKKLEMVSSYDYQFIVGQLLKSFIRAKLENMFDKDATEKSNVAIEAPLSELDLDDKNTEKGGDGARQGLGKSKNKKKKRRSQKR